MTMRWMPLALLCILPAWHMAARAEAASAGPGRTAVVARAAELLRERYTDAPKAERLADGLLARAAALDAAPTPQEFAAGVTRAMQELVPDLHLRMSYEPEREFVAGSGPDRAVRPGVVRTGRIDGRSVEAIARSNYGFSAVERLDGNIGYLRISRFVPLDLARATAQAALGFLANVDALVIDLRGNIGGSPDTVNFIYSHLYPPGEQPRLLHASWNRYRKLDTRIMTDPSLGNARLSRAPVYVLIDRSTASAAEMFAYAGQRLGRATVIGETSSGAGNGGAKHSVGQGYALFLPEVRVVTGPGWERTGVKPDMATAPAAALDAARRAALTVLLEQEGIAADQRAERERALAGLPAP